MAKNIILLILCASVFEIKCDTICKQDGDDLGFVLKNKCYCGNLRDIQHIPIKINRAYNPDPKPPRGYYE